MYSFYNTVFGLFIFNLHTCGYHSSNRVTCERNKSIIDIVARRYIRGMRMYTVYTWHYLPTLCTECEIFLEILEIILYGSSYTKWSHLKNFLLKKMLQIYSLFIDFLSPYSIYRTESRATIKATRVHDDYSYKILLEPLLKFGFGGGKLKPQNTFRNGNTNQGTSFLQ